MTGWIVGRLDHNGLRTDSNLVTASDRVYLVTLCDFQDPSANVTGTTAAGGMEIDTTRGPSTGNG